MNIKKLSEVLYSDQPNQNANVIIEDDGNLRKTALPAGGVTPEIEAEIENAQWKTETSTPLFSETVTANETPFGGKASFTYDEFINAKTIIVTFDGVKYTCDRRFPSDDSDSYYGAPSTESGYDFSEYPFSISSAKNEVGALNSAVTQSPGEHTVSISTESITYTDAFKKGVAENSTFYVDFEDGVNGFVCNKTLSEIATAYEAGANVLGRYAGAIYLYSNTEHIFSHTHIDRLNNEVVIREIVLFDNPNVTTIEQFEARVSATISGGGSHPIG